jgi:predicted RNA binding protein YcfA (HicA-like mRNA interferase family)
MTRLPRLTGKDAVRVLRKIGFQIVRTRGSSHVFVRHADGRPLFQSMRTKYLGLGSTAQFFAMLNFLSQIY